MLLSPCGKRLASEEAELELSLSELEWASRLTEDGGVVPVAPFVLAGFAGVVAVAVTLDVVVDGAVAVPSLPLPHAVTPTVSSVLATSASSGFIFPASPFLY
jgi:hypothetical protein